MVALKFFVVGLLLLVNDAYGLADGDRDEPENPADVLEVSKRQTWGEFQRKHVHIASSMVYDVDYWNDVALDQLQRDYGRPRNTFIRTNYINNVVAAFSGDLYQCPLAGLGQYEESNTELELADLTWNNALEDYDVHYPGYRYVCAAVEGGLPVHFAGYV